MGEYHRDPEIGTALTKFRRRDSRPPPTLLIVVLVIAAAVLVLTAGFTTLGAGRSCEAWTADQRSNGKLAMLDEQWVLGFLSGIAASQGNDLLVGVDPKVILQRVDEFCTAHPSDDMTAAALEAVRD